MPGAHLCATSESLKGGRTWKFFVCSSIRVKISSFFFILQNFLPCRPLRHLAEFEHVINGMFDWDERSS